VKKSERQLVHEFGSYDFRIGQKSGRSRSEKGKKGGGGEREEKGKDIPDHPREYRQFLHVKGWCLGLRGVGSERAASRMQRRQTAVQKSDAGELLYH